MGTVSVWVIVDTVVVILGERQLLQMTLAFCGLDLPKWSKQPTKPMTATKTSLFLLAYWLATDSQRLAFVAVQRRVWGEVLMVQHRYPCGSHSRGVRCSCGRVSILSCGNRRYAHALRNRSWGLSRRSSGRCADACDTPMIHAF